MKVLIDNKLEEINRDTFVRLISGYKKIHLDIGTGDGRFLYKSAKQNISTLYIGLDPAVKQLELYYKKAQRDRLKNTMFVMGSIELFPVEFFGLINETTILFPWGSLLGKIVAADKTLISKLRKLFKGNGSLKILFGYSQDAEPTEVERLGLQKLSVNYIYTNIIPAFLSEGFKVDCLRMLEKDDLNDFETTWSKKLRFGQDRPLFYLTLNISE